MRQLEERELFYLLIAGSREYENYKEFSKVVDNILKEQRKLNRTIFIVSGHASGADTLAEKYAAEHRDRIHVISAEWDKYGKKAGYIRNCKMHEYIAPHENRGCLCFWDTVKQSRGTAQNFGLCKAHDTPLRIYDIGVHKYVSKEKTKELEEKF